MVRVSGAVNRSAFSDSEGHFQFENMPAGQIVLIAQKPGFSSEQVEGGNARFFHLGPNTGAQTVKLVPQSAIYGRVLDASGQPIERISVRLSARQLRDGRMRWDARGMSQTDDDGHFRFANLNPGTYFLAAGPAQSEDRILPNGEKPSTGYPHLYYPGVPELSSAAPLQVIAGQQLQADFTVSPVPVYHISGSITGQVNENHGVGIQMFTSSSDEIWLPVHENSELGTFSIDSVPAGSYVLRAMSTADLQPLRAEQKINVAGNLENVNLALAPAVSIPIVAHMQSRAPSGPNTSPWSEERPPVSVSLLPAQPNAPESFATFEQLNGRNAMRLPNVDPGSYTVRLMPQPPWYVQSATYGQTNALTDDITVTSGQSFPLDILLRDDSANLDVTVKGFENGVGPRPTVLVIPQPSSKAMPRVPTGFTTNGFTSTFNDTGLAPGEYLVYAFDRIDSLEYSNPDALAPYASQAAHVTLTANQTAQVTLDLIHMGKGE